MEQLMSLAQKIAEREAIAFKPREKVNIVWNEGLYSHINGTLSMELSEAGYDNILVKLPNDVFKETIMQAMLLAGYNILGVAEHGIELLF